MVTETTTARRARRRTKRDESTEEGEASIFTGASFAASLSKMDNIALGDSDLRSDIKDYISTQTATIDNAITRNGVPTGRLTTFIGKEGGGKSTLVYHLLAEVQRRGGVGILADAENRFSRDRAERIGIDLKNLVIIQAKEGEILTVETVMQRIEKIAKKLAAEAPNLLTLIAVDSLSALPSKDALTKEIGEASTALVARCVSQALPRILPILADTSAALVIVNQLRAHVDFNNQGRSNERRKVMREKGMIAEGALVYYSSLILYITSTGLVGERDEPTGSTNRVENRKCSIGPGEGRRGEFEIDSINGVNIVGAKLELAEKAGLVTQSGGWYKYEGREKTFRAAQFADILEEFPELDEAIAKVPTSWIPEE